MTEKQGFRITGRFLKMFFLSLFFALAMGAFFFFLDQAGIFPRANPDKPGYFLIGLGTILGYNLGIIVSSRIFLKRK
ncbi:MAG: hypothetical protein ACD_62C00607G0009 [uncultured bacterium]|nr:MAG: hypothetical protein ACD_62C00607G0009 [uncultured bacterium]HLD44484.1 hypothetical protein [bacterium]